MKKILTMILMVLSSVIYAQSETITGTLYNEDGVPFVGATVFVAGTSKGVLADFDGAFTIEVTSPVEKKSLRITSLGYETTTVLIGDIRNFNITLKPDVESLDEVVVVGYGTVKKSDLTGAVSSIKAKDIEKIGAIGIEQALSGQAAGVSVTQASGALGSGASITIRGLSSLSSSEPLYVIDGIPMDNTTAAGLGMADEDLESSQISPLSLINPADIESVEVLKDASSTAIYGSRGANGVILITTKEGKEGVGVINIDHSFSVLQIPNFIDLLDANEYAILKDEAKANSSSGGYSPYVYPDVPGSRIDSARLGLLESTNWQDELIRMGTSSNTNISFSGGSKDLNYMVSTGILNAEGIVDQTDLDRITSKISLRGNVNERLKIGVSVNYAHVTSNQKGINTKDNNTKGSTSALSRAFRAPPYAKYEEEVDEEEDLDGLSPVTALLANNYDNLLTEFRGGLKLDYKFSNNLVFKTSLSHQNRNTEKNYYQEDLLERFTEGGKAKSSNTRTTRSTITNTLNYKAKFGKHKITALLGQSLETSETKSISIANFGFSNDYLTYYAPETASFYDPDQITYTDNNLSSWFGRVNYISPKSKYLVTLTGRYEGSSKFADNNKWAFFPAAAVAYKMTKESFMKDVSFVNELKLRTSFGYSGNQAIKSYQSLSQYEPGITGFNESQTAYYNNYQLPNPDLTWETTSQLDFGVDFGLFKNVITGTFEYYLKETKDLLFADNAIAVQSGFPTYTENYGSLQTEGLEMNLTAHIIEKKNFSWTFSGNVGTGKTIITEMASDYIQSGWDPGTISGGTQRLIVGEEVGAFYGYQTSGIAQFDDFVEFQGLTNEDQIKLFNQNRAKGDYTFVSGFDGGVPSSNTNKRPGEQLYEDLDGSGDFNEADRQVIGLAQPDVSFGITNSFKLGKVDFSFFFDSQLGKEIVAIQNTRLLEFADRQALSLALERWTPENPSSVFPSVNTDNRENLFSSRYIEDGSFIRLQNVSIGYSFPKSITSKLNVASLRLFASATNVYTWTNYTGYSPDVSLRGSSTKAIGHDKGGYPLARTMRLGVKLKF